MFFLMPLNRHSSPHYRRRPPPTPHLLVDTFIHGARMDLQVRLKARGRQLVGQNHIPACKEIWVAEYVIGGGG